MRSFAPDLCNEKAIINQWQVGDRRRYEIVKRLGERPDAISCGTVRDCTGINPATLSHHMKELEIAGLVEVVREGKFFAQLCLTARRA